MAKLVKMSGGKLKHEVRDYPPTVDGGRVKGGKKGRNNRYNALGRSYAWRVEAQREIAKGFENDSRSLGRSLRKGVNIRSF